jgi:uncharacterized peroxidase-related enzyme
MTFNPIELHHANAEAKAALDIVQSAFGGIPNLMKMLAIAPNVLHGAIVFSQAISSGELEPSLFEQIALLTSAMNQCEYCVACHVQVGQQTGLSRNELIDNLQGEANDPRSQAVLNFTKAVINNRGQVDPITVQTLQEYGFSNKAILEMIAVIGLYTFLNYAKHLTQPVLDFPAVPEFQPEVKPPQLDLHMNRFYNE